MNEETNKDGCNIVSSTTTWLYNKQTEPCEEIENNAGFQSPAELSESEEQANKPANGEKAEKQSNTVSLPIRVIFNENTGKCQLVQEKREEPEKAAHSEKADTQPGWKWQCNIL